MDAYYKQGVLFRPGSLTDLAFIPSFTELMISQLLCAGIVGVGIWREGKRHPRLTQRGSHPGQGRQETPAGVCDIA